MNRIDPIPKPKSFSSAPPAEMMFIHSKHSPRIICAYTNIEEAFVIVALNDGRNVFLDFSWFATSEDGLSPDFTSVTVEDYGYSLCFGDYSVDVLSILKSYKMVPDFIVRLALLSLNPANHRKMLDVVINAVREEDNWEVLKAVHVIDLIDCQPYNNVVIGYPSKTGDPIDWNIDADCTRISGGITGGTFSPEYLGGWKWFFSEMKDNSNV